MEISPVWPDLSVPMTVGCHIRGVRMITGSISKSPATAAMRMDAGALKKVAMAPIPNVPNGPIPMHWATAPKAAPRLSGVDASNVMVYCMVAKPERPSPTSNNKKNDRENQGDRANSSRAISCSMLPPANTRP